ncbi:helix-turn-helix domain-containing protein [Dellaglioa algida]|uniref:helix-turn-helix domain-containing protein n=1 Tax=Dellaglioa algida TaxID=105612 RepID=UPI0024DED6D3|nr:helix-turn-helix transcriptional regulator [Dellaglioa algida]MDK1740075.1 helix-turn-helix domain-containing protein [Dellaglioa algida]
MDENNKMIGQRIAKIRKLKNMRQAELAKKIELKPSALGNYERGDRSIPATIIENIASGLEVPAWLITRGIPKDMPEKYSYDFFINASTDDLQKFYMFQTQQLTNDIHDKSEKNRKLIEAYVTYIFDDNLLESQSELFKVVQLLIDKTIIRERLDRIIAFPDDPNAKKYNDFKFYLDRNNIDLN